MTFLPPATIPRRIERKHREGIQSIAFIPSINSLLENFCAELKNSKKMDLSKVEQEINFGFVFITWYLD